MKGLKKTNEKVRLLLSIKLSLIKSERRQKKEITRGAPRASFFHKKSEKKQVAIWLCRTSLLTALKLPLRIKSSKVTYKAAKRNIVSRIKDSFTIRINCLNQISRTLSFPNPALLRKKSSLQEVHRKWEKQKFFLRFKINLK